jgi:hypothetical protein
MSIAGAVKRSQRKLRVAKLVVACMYVRAIRTKFRALMVVVQLRSAVAHLVRAKPIFTLT